MPGVHNSMERDVGKAADGVPVGAICTTDDSNHLLLREVFLLPSYQAQGIGSKIVQQGLATARRAKKPLRLRVLRENQARELYERLGLVVYEETETHFWMETA